MELQLCIAMLAGVTRRGGRERDSEEVLLSKKLHLFARFRFDGTEGVTS